MKKDNIISLLVPGIIAGAVLGFGLGMLAGVNGENPIPNYIGGVLCCLVPTLLNCLIVTKGAAKALKREISVGAVFKRILPYALCAGIIGLVLYVVVLESMLGMDSRMFSRVGNAIMQACFGIVTSTFFGYIAIKSYAKDVKYTKRTKK